MPGYLCDDCEETVPQTRYCPECGSSSGMISIGNIADYDIAEHFSNIALNARDESVSFDTLRSKHDSYSKPLGSYIHSDEQPELICEIKKCTVDGVEGSSWKFSAGILDSGHLFITNKRIIAIFPKKEKSQLIDVYFSDSIAISESSNWRSSKLTVEDFQGYEYDFFLNTEQDTFETATDIVHERHESVDSENSSAVKFLNKMDAEVAEADDAESALHAIATLFENRSEKTNFDQAVAESDSIEELGQAIVTMPGIGIFDGKTQQSQMTTKLANPEIEITDLQQRVTQVARNTDPKDVGKYSLGALLGFGGYAVSAPFSTTVGVAALLFGGAATGAYASKNPDSIAAEIEPIHFAMNAKNRGSQLASDPGAGGHKTGAALGMIEYLGQEQYDNLDEAYAKWLSEIDIESVMEGQKVAARHANNTNKLGDPEQASLLGGAAGLAYGYTDIEEDLEEVAGGDVVDGHLDASTHQEN